MSHNSNTPVRTFTIGFAAEDFDERHLARLVADQFHTHHLEREVTPSDGQQIMSTLAAHYDEPFGDSSALPTYVVSKIAKEHVTVALTGDGGDEVLCGYTVHQGEKFAGSYSRLPKVVQRTLVPALVGGASAVAPTRLKPQLIRTRHVINSSALDFIDRLEAKQTGLAHQDRDRLIVDKKAVIPTREFIETALDPVKGRDNFTRLNYWLHTVSLPDDMLCKVDRAAMASSLETRTPFLDYRIIELLAQVSMKIKLVGYERKRILRRTIGRTLPEPLLRASKRGFAVPLRDWFRNGAGGGIEQHARELGDKGLLRTRDLMHIIGQHRNGDQNAARALWVLAMAAYHV